MTEQAGTKLIRVMVVDDHLDFRYLMEVLLNEQSDLELVSEAGSLAEARAYAARFEIDVVILDLGLPDGNGVDLLADLRHANADVRVLILSASLDAETFERATEADADEIMDKLAPLNEVLATIRRLGST
jgi:DNA-binding NarL/FixJ family response regulator